MMGRKKAYYQGVRMAPYDLVKEFLLAMAVVTLLVILLAAFLSSPDEPPLTIKGIAQAHPLDYVTTVLSELNGSSTIAGYGEPYNNQSGSVQHIGPTSWGISPQQWAGIHIPVDTAQDFVLGPLSQAAATDPTLKAALGRFTRASATQQGKWEDAYTKALSSKQVKEAPPNLSVPSCACGPLPTMLMSLLRLGQSGAMDGLLLTTPRYFQTDYTRPLLFLADNGAVADHAQQFHLLGSQWGVMNETGNYPGQAWLWLYTLFYQIPPYNTAWSANTDILAILSVTVLTLLLLFLPWIPGLNRLPRYVKVYRLIWKDYYREPRSQPPGSPRLETGSPGATPVEGA
jgi:hypothetical protein